MKQIKLGKIYTTQGITSTMKINDGFAKFVYDSLAKHSHGEWGDLCKEDKELNDMAMESENDRLFSKYIYRKGKKDSLSIYIITEWDRSATTILFPSEY